jgi:hypothetical protein
MDSQQSVGKGAVREVINRLDRLRNVQLLRAFAVL